MSHTDRLDFLTVADQLNLATCAQKRALKLCGNEDTKPAWRGEKQAVLLWTERVTARLCFMRGL